MRIIQINTVPNGSTGTIMMNIHRLLQSKGHDSYVVWGRGRKSNSKYEIYMNDKLGVYMHTLYARITGKVGFFSKRATRKLLKKIDDIQPDIIHLHNIHGYYINIEMLFNYIKEKNIRVIWTLHDCWSFTGHCSFFDMVDCKKWKTQCDNCTQIGCYPKSIKDNSRIAFEKKKNIFLGVKDLTIVTPSKWLAKKIDESFLKEYNIKIINNGIDLNKFKNIKKSNLTFRKKYNLKEQKIILGVASPWSDRKGLKDFIELSKIIDEKYKIVLVGLSKKQIKQIPSNILGLRRTNSIEELIEIYNEADILFNPTYEDNYPTVNIESIACRTPVVTYNTGGSPEAGKICNSGTVINKKDYSNLLKIINDRKTKFKFTNIERLSDKYMFENYLNLYDVVIIEDEEKNKENNKCN